VDELELGWVAALLSPREVGPHPNFWSGEEVTPYGVLSLLASGRHHDYARLATEEGGDGGRWALVINYLPLFDAVRSSMTVGTVRHGVEKLIDFAARGVGDDRDLALRASSAVLSTVGLTEIDRIQQADELLSQLLAEAEADPSPSAALLQAWILCVRSQNRWDAGENPQQFAARALEQIGSIELTQLPGFVVSKGASVDSEGCMRQLLASLRWVAENHVVSAATDFGERVALVRIPVPRPALRARGRAADALADRLESDFNCNFAASQQRRMSFGGDLTGDQALTEALLWHEYVGSPSVHHYRGLLGMSRFLTGRLQGEAWMLEEGLRLLKHAQLEKHVAFACISLLRQGPLSVLRAQAENVISAQVSQDSASPVDLAVIKHAATIIDDRDRSRALDALMRVRATPPGSRGLSWQHPFSYVEKVWEAITELAMASGTPAEALAVLISDVLQRSESGGDFADHVYARLISIWDEGAWRDEQVSSLTDALRERTRSGDLPLVKRALARVTDVVVPEMADAAVEGSMSLEVAARHVDRMLTVVADIPMGVTEILISFLRSQMEGVRTGASAGRYSGGVLSGADIAVAFMFTTGRDDLWQDVLDLLVDSRVQRDDKTQALERMARNLDQLPDWVRKRVAERAADLLAGGPQFLGDAVEPYPPAMRLLSLLGAFTQGEPLQFVAGLMAQRTPEATREAAYSVLALLHFGGDFEWLLTTATWLSYEADPEVRSLAGQALALASGPWDELGRAARLQTLLEEDGVFVPLRVLQGLQQAMQRWPDGLRDAVASLASTHPSVQVRESAEAALAQDRGSSTKEQPGDAARGGTRRLGRRRQR